MLYSRGKPPESPREVLPLTIDEELQLLEENVRRLKVDYDVFFGGGSKVPPAEAEFRVKAMLKKHADGQRMNFGQRFKYNSIAQRYALYSDLWRQKLKIKEEGYRRPQDALLGVTGIRTDSEHEAAAALEQAETGRFSLTYSDSEPDEQKIQTLYEAMITARQHTGQPGASGNLDSFKIFVRKKTEQLRKDYGCHSVEYVIEVEAGQVKLKAKPRI
jgi:hypothetical protein